MNYCNKCESYQYRIRNKKNRCTNLLVISKSEKIEAHVLVHGAERKRLHISCKKARMSSHYCGKQGKYFELSGTEKLRERMKNES